MAHIARTATAVVTLAATVATAVGTGLVYAETLGTAATRSPATRPVAPDASSATPIAHVEHAVEAEPKTDVVAPPLTDAQQELVDWARTRFAEAGLELPELTVRFDPTRERCDHNDGRYQHTPDGERVVTICTRAGDSFAAELDQRRTLLHEFGHAWDFANLSDDDHDHLGHLLGVETWNDHDDAWEDRGVERFAETFVYALLDQRRRQLKVTLECTALIGAFRTATGAEPLGPDAPHCAV